MIAIKEDRTLDQVRGRVKSFKSQIRKAELSYKVSQAYITGTWAGYLDSLHTAGTISHEEYQELYDELADYATGIEFIGEGRW